MPSARVNMRIDQELWGWVAVYAKRRDATRTEVVEEALREFREACEGGAPGVQARTPRQRESRTVAPAARAVTPYMTIMLERQARLNKGRG